VDGNGFAGLCSNPFSGLALRRPAVHHPSITQEGQLFTPPTLRNLSGNSAEKPNFFNKRGPIQRRQHLQNQTPAKWISTCLPELVHYYCPQPTDGSEPGPSAISATAVARPAATETPVFEVLPRWGLRRGNTSSRFRTDFISSSIQKKSPLELSDSGPRAGRTAQLALASHWGFSLKPAELE